MYEITILNYRYEETETYPTLKAAESAIKSALKDDDTIYVYGPTKGKED